MKTTCVVSEFYSKKSLGNYCTFEDNIITYNIAWLLFSGNSSNFVANRIHLNTNVSEINVDNGLTPDALILIRFPEGEISTHGMICKLAF